VVDLNKKSSQQAVQLGKCDRCFTSNTAFWWRIARQVAQKHLRQGGEEALNATASTRRSSTPLPGNKFQDTFTINPYTAMIYWITPVTSDKPADPVWIEAALEDGNVILRLAAEFGTVVLFVRGVPDGRQ
jgi:hypothetical protein